MHTKSYPTPLATFIFLILLLQIVASLFYWYWRIPWFDILMHFLGGMWVTLSALWIYYFSERKILSLKQSPLTVFIAGLGTVLFVAVLWEVFEYVVFIMIPHALPYNMSDTIGDIISGVIGGFVGAGLFLKRMKGSTGT